MRHRPELKQILGTALVLVILLGMGWLSYRQWRAAVRALELRSQARTVIQGLTELLSDLKDAETGQRGFLLTGDEAFLEPYLRGRGAAREELQRVADLMESREPGSAAALNGLREPLEDKLAELDATVALARAGRREEALARVKQGRGRADMDRVRSEQAALVDKESALRTQLDQEAREGGRRSLVLTLLLGGLAAAALVASALLRALEARARGRAEEARERALRILEGTPDLVCMATAAGEMTYGNAAWREVMGLPEGARGLEFLERHYHPDWAMAVVRDQGIPTAMAEGVWRGDTALLARDGREIPVSQVILAHRDASGAVTHFSAICRDMTELQQAQSAQREAEGRFRTMVESVQDYAIVALDPEGCVRSWNLGAERIQGYKAEEILGRPISEFFLREDREAARPGRELAAAAEKGRVEDEGWRLRKDGSRFWANVVLTAVRDGRGELQGFLKVTRDLTERRRAEEALRRHQAFLDSIFESLPAMLFIKDAQDLRFVRFNKAGEELLGIPREQLLGRSDRDFFPAEQAEAFIAKDRAVLEAGQLADIPEEPIRTAAGATRWLHTRKIPLPGADGQPGHLLGISEDITERKAAEEALRQSEARFRALADKAPVGIFEMDLEGRRTYINPRLAELAGLPFEEAAGAGFRRALHPEDVERVLEHWAQVRAVGRDSELEYRFIHPESGEVHWVQSHAAPVRGAGEEIRSYIGIVRDVTEQRRHEAVLNALNAALEGKAQALQASNRELEAFAYSVSHDLRAPLRHIDGFAGLLKKGLEGHLSERQSHQLDVVCDSARRMGELIDDLLSYSRIGRTELNKVDLPLEPLFRQVQESLAHELEAREVELRVDPLPVVHGDPVLLRLVAQNLLGNAVKYSSKTEGARIRVGVAEAGPDEVAVFVEDNGAGFDMAYVHKLFGVFQRLHRMDEFEGTGIGLANVSRIIQRHGGRVWAKGEVGKGATFFFALPSQGAGT